jgi:hypothetical protein
MDASSHRRHAAALAPSPPRPYASEWWHIDWGTRTCTSKVGFYDGSLGAATPAQQVENWKNLSTAMNPHPYVIDNCDGPVGVNDGDGYTRWFYRALDACNKAVANAASDKKAARAAEAKVLDQYR